ncbi:PD-(D/E)XK nuclease family protein [Lentzea sp. NPDC042327]|uniref:PD-(D/E)XK nuclease family protein n=1 Tax=Lentzea sp. NPDC042327 TaxID=3154801 RepID=UPI0033CC0A99
MAALDLVEFGGVEAAEAVRRALIPTRGRYNHDGIAEWTRHAVAGYLEAFGGDEAMPVRMPWQQVVRLAQPDQRGVRHYEINAWGRRYRTADGVNELRMIGFRNGKRGTGELAVAGFVATSGEPAPERVRIREFSCLTGEAALVYDRTRAEVLEHYREHGRDALRNAVDGDEYRPGEPCVECRFRAVCPERVETPGVLGIADRSRPRRTWSVTNARKYRECPARDHLGRLRLPKAAAVEHGPAAERGRAVHAYVEHRHRSGAGCVPDVPDTWPDRELPAREIAAGTAMLRHHAEVCPLSLAPSELRMEPVLTFDDTAADVVVIAKPDLLYRDGDSLVWRELKTTRSDPDRLFRTLTEIPQLALAVVLLGQGAIRDAGPHPRVELELLHPDGNDLRIYDVRDPAVRAEAEAVVTSLAAPWHGDDEFPAHPGPGCRTCEVVRWCPAGQAEVAP